MMGIMHDKVLSNLAQAFRQGTDPAQLRGLAERWHLPSSTIKSLEAVRELERKLQEPNQSAE